MDYILIFPIIIIILGFGYFLVTIFLYKKKTVPIGIPNMPFFWMIKKENNLRYFLISILFNIIMSFIFIIAGIILLINIL